MTAVSKLHTTEAGTNHHEDRISTSRSLRSDVQPPRGELIGSFSPAMLCFLTCKPEPVRYSSRLAEGCGSCTRRICCCFDVRWTGSKLPARKLASVAQRQSSGFVNRWLWVRIPPLALVDGSRVAVIAVITTSAKSGGVPERPKGSDCKSDGSAFTGSNPVTPTTITRIGGQLPKRVSSC